MKIERYARPLALVVLALVTAYGVQQFLVGDWQASAEFWRGRLWLLPAVLLLATIDVLMEGVSWAWIYERFGIRAKSWAGASAYLAGRAGLLLPAQLGRLIRPDAMSRMGLGSMSDALKAEAVIFVLDTASVMALLAGLIVGLAHPLLGVAAGSVVLAGTLLFGNLAAKLLFHTRLSLPPSIWWSWRTLAVLLIQMSGWVVHGFALWVLARELSASIEISDMLLYAAGSSVLGVASGLPGGIGATELMLGIFLGVAEVPKEQLVVVVVAFRALTFWIWIPLGWAMLVRTKRRLSGVAASPATE